MKKVSVIVPYYGVEKYIARCLDSLLDQDYPNYDVILVDDCSPDGSRAIVERYLAAHPDRLRLIVNDENLGQGRSRMRAVAASDAEYVMFVDSDDYVAPDYISRFVAADTAGYDLIIAGFTRDIDGKKKPYRVIESGYTLLLYSVACCKMFRRAFMLENRIDFSDSRKGEDIFFFLSFFASRPKYRFIDYYGYYYRLNRNSTTQRMNHQTDFEQIVIRMFGMFRAKYDLAALPEDMRRMLEYAYVANIVNALAVYGHGCGVKRMDEKLARVERDIAAHHPGLMRHPDLRFFRPRGVRAKVRLGVGLFYWSRRLHLYRALFRALSRV